MILRKRHIILTMFLLFLGGVVNEAWAKKVTYHILTKPFTVRNYNNTGDFRSDIRVEALQCTSEGTTVGLPDQFKSPLATNFRYWKSATSTYDKLYDSGHSSKIITTKLNIYQCAEGNSYACLSGEIANPESTSTDADGIPNDIYVTYDYIGDSNNILKLDGATPYNVSLLSGNKLKFMCFNRSRNNRVANANAGALSGEHLASDDFVIPEEGTADDQLSFNYGKWGPIGVFLGFKFIGEDPYNFTIMTSYAGEELHITDKITNVDNTGTIKPYAGATLMAKVAATSLWFDCSNDRHYKLESGISDAGKWTAAKYAECKQTFSTTDVQDRYDTWVGFYRYESPTMNSFALLPNLNADGYIIVGSKMNQGDGNSAKPTINQPNSSGQYYSYYDNYDNSESGANGKRRSQPYFKLQAFSSALPINFYEIRTYTLHVITKGSNTTLTKTIKWSDAKVSEQIVKHVPDDLNRKYVTFTKAYTDAGKSNEISTFADAQAAGTNEIWLDYETSSNLPFEVLPNGGDYKNARWYTLRVNGKAEQKNIAYHSSNQFITGSSSIGSESDLHQGENSAEVQVAFMGDPFELKIISRAASESATANRYIGCATDATDGTTLNTDKEGTTDISTWEIVYESTNIGNFILREFNTVAAPKYIGWDDASTNKPVVYSTAAYTDKNRIRPVPLEEISYIYHIVRNDVGDIAVKASSSHDVGKMLRSWLDIPEIIRSPFLAPSYSAAVTFYATLADAKAKTNAITNAPYDSNRDIYVRYSYGTPLVGSTFNVRLNNDYIYTSSSDYVIHSQPSITTQEAASNPYQWALDYSDPYAMTIRSLGKSTDAGANRYVKYTSLSNDASIEWNATPSIFVAKSGSITGTYEVMVATGDGVDASATYYNIGRPDENTVKLYDNSINGYLHGNATLRFQLIGTNAHDVVYHLVDKSNSDLLQAETRQTNTDFIDFPPEYHSPLVNKYYYYPTLADATAGTNEIDMDNDETNKVGTRTDIYVTYDVNNLVNLKRGQLYRLKYEAGQYFNQEDGSDGVNPTAQKAVYPYVNGDCNFFVYGEEQYEIQRHASSTRTRWVWYVQSDLGDKGDPYHVKIRSFQSESYPITNPSDYNAFFATYKPEGYSEVVTTLVFPGISGEAETEYMVLGSEGQYQLVTTNTIPIDLNNDGDYDEEGESNVRHTVNSFEQYWKTFDTIRKKIYGDSNYTENDSDPITIPLDTKSHINSTDDQTLRDYLEDDLKWHHYEKWAYAKRWNGFNNGYSSTDGTHEKKKGWEKIEHWYQTINMGQGYFDFVETSIDPVLILLDQHGWEIMRKPLPSSPDDPDKNTKYEAIRPYNSPMVKEYAFWATAKKRTGFHQYYLLSDRIGGDDFTSTDLTDLPPYNSQNVKDKKGNLNDQYVTYIVKDEYAQSYDPSTETGKSFLIEQGINNKYATTNAEGTTLTASAIPHNGDMKAHILNDAIPNTELWYVRPNVNIDIEMGYGDTGVNTDWGTKTPNAYTDDSYKTLKTAIYIDQTDAYKNANADDKKAIKDKFGLFSFSNGFDPYNIQISPVDHTTQFMKTNADGMNLVDGIMYGTYPTDPGPDISLDGTTPTVTAKWYDGRNQAITNTTWMAVQDADGNMQLMPRFDHDRRMSEFGMLIAPTDAEVAKTYTKLYRPEIYEYLIIDNSGNESLRYKSGGDLMPQTPDHFKSPLATNFTYYTDNTCTNEISNSLDGVTLTDNKIYVRYDYDEEADGQKILRGNWQTMQLNNLDAKYDDGIKQGTGKPATINSSEKAWQWKLLETPQNKPDPYAVYLYNRSQSEGTKAIDKRFAVLSHTSGGYALAEAGLGTAGNYDYTYKFLNGASMSTTEAATTATESGFKSTTCSFSNTDSQVKFIDDVEHTFTYNVYTNSGVLAINATQDDETVKSNEYVPTLPSNIKSPLLLKEQYLYYNKVDYNRIVEEKPDTVGKSLPYLYGLYDDEVVVRYTPYNSLGTEYLVPNVRNATNSSTVDKGTGSNDAALDINGNLLYNIIWYDDNMMRSFISGDAGEVEVIRSTANQPLQYTAAYEWKFEGNDPYAIKIKSVGASDNTTTKYIDNSCHLSATPQTFMILDRYNHDYGVLATTGDETKMLSGYGNAIATSTEPTKFIIFALATHKVIYHLMIKNIGEDIIIPYKGSETNDILVDNYKIKTGTTWRDLRTQDSSSGESGHIDGDLYQLGESLSAIKSRMEYNENITISNKGLWAQDLTYCYDAGHISLGDVLEVPSEFYRPNVVYEFFVGGVYDAKGENDQRDMNNIYKGKNLNEGHAKPQMGDNPDLLNTTVFINIVYSFNGALETNSGSDFVTNVSQNKWYTFETSGATPKLAEYSDKLQTKSGYATHYTNDYLWTPVGDPYGFKMYNRYLYKNLNQTTTVMTTESFAEGKTIKMAEPGSTITNENSESVTVTSGNEVYELLTSNTPGYFRVHPVVNKKTTVDPRQYYIRDDNGVLKLSLTATEWTFGLSLDVMRPYYEGAGYVGGLNAAGKAAYEAKLDNSEKTEMEKLMALQDVVYNHDNDDSDHDNNPNYIVHFAPGYYRLHNQPGSTGISTPRYASGYTHAIERDPNEDNSEADAIPMHFYEQTEYSVDNPVFSDLGTADTDFTQTKATRGDIPLLTVTYDPASIFHFTGEASGATMSTQGLNVVGNKMTTGTGTSFTIIDIGGAIVALNNSTDYLSYKQNSSKYDLKYGNYPDESARWCMQPVQKAATAGVGEMELRVATHNGGDTYYYTTFCAPFDVLLTNAANDKAYVVSSDKWNTDILYPEAIGQHNTGGYTGNDQFIPAGTPVIIRTKSTTGYVTMALPTTTPSTPVSCAFSGKYLEQMLTHGSDYVYAFGRPYTGTFTEAGDFSTSGVITASAPTEGKGVGFYKNANFYREEHGFKPWNHNNKYVYANKIYYRDGSSGASSRPDTRGVDFIPVVFDGDDEEMPGEDQQEGRTAVGDGRAYDLQGRCVATAGQVKDGTWRNGLKPGIYIVNGKKISIGRR